MAKNYQDIYKSVYTTGNKMDWSNAMIRGNGIPLDIYSVFDSYNAAVTFAAKNAVAYEGEVLAVTENGDTTVYVITPKLQGTVIIDEVETQVYIKEVGKATVGDDKTIVLSADGQLSLKNFGTEYYAYKETENGVEYEKTQGWKDGLTPKVIKVTNEQGVESFEIAWYEPSTTTVEGLSESISNINTQIGDINKDKADRATTLAGYGIKDAYTKTETDNAIDTKISALGNVFNLKAVTDDITKIDVNTLNPGDVVLVKIKDASGNDIEIEYVVVEEDGVKRYEKFGDPTGVSGAVKRIADLEDVVGDSTKGLVKDVSDIDGRVSTAEEKITKLEGTVGDSNKGLVKDVADHTTDIDNINIEIGNDDSADTIKGRIKSLETTVTDTTNGLVKKVETNTIDISNINKKLGDNFETNAQVNKIESASIKTATGTATITEGTKNLVIDITKVTDAASADSAKATVGTLTAFGKTFNGSEDKTITKEDIGVATPTNIGLVKSGDTSTIGSVVVNSEGYMSINKVSMASSADKASKVDKSLKWSDGETEVTFDGSEEKTLTLAGLGFDSANYATAEQGKKADSAIQSIKIGDTSFVKTAGEAVVSKDDARTALGIGTAANHAEEDFATAEQFNSLDGVVVKNTGNQTIEGNKTFSSPVSVATPTAETHATTKKYVDDALAKKLAAGDAMTFKGLLGTGGNITELPTSNVNNGDTYKVITAGKYANVNAKVGDMYIAVVSQGEDSSVSIDWTYIPSGDDGNLYQGTSEKYKTNGLTIAKDNGVVETLEFGTAGQILKSDGDGKTPKWVNEKTYAVSSGTDGLSVESTTNNDEINYKVTLSSVSTDILTQGTNTLILNGGTANA